MTTPADEPKEGEPGWDERRELDRAAITLRVDYKRLNTFFADYTKNISKGGTFIRTTKPLDVGTEFVFVLTFPAKEDNLKLRGEVMWITSEAEANEKANKPPGMGIRFLFNNDSERQAVDDFVEGLMSQALGEHISTKLLSRK